MTTSKSLLPRSSIKTGPSPINRNHFNQGAFLLKKTEISVESEVVESLSNGRFSDQASISSSRDEKRGRSIFGKSNDSQCDDRSSIHSGAWRSSEDLAKNFDSLSFGTTVSIEAAPAVKACEQRLHEMRGLEQAASMKRWAGDGKPAEAWGKLSKVSRMVKSLPAENQQIENTDIHRIPNFGTRLAMLWCTSAIRDHRHLLGSGSHFLKILNRSS